MSYFFKNNKIKLNSYIKFKKNAKAKMELKLENPYPL